MDNEKIEIVRSIAEESMQQEKDRAALVQAKTQNLIKYISTTDMKDQDRYAINRKPHIERKDDALYKVLKKVILDEVPVCISKEGAEVNGRSLKVENLA